MFWSVRSGSFNEIEWDKSAPVSRRMHIPCLLGHGDWRGFFVGRGMIQSSAVRQSAADVPIDLRTRRLERVFVRYQDELLGTLHFLVGDVEDARLGLQETFAVCWRARDRMATEDNLKASVFRTALAVGRDMRGSAWRRRRRPLGAANLTLVAVPADHQTNPARRDRLGIIRCMLSRLRREEREVFLLRINARLTYEEIARIMLVSPSAVKKRMRTALRRIREGLE